MRGRRVATGIVVAAALVIGGVFVVTLAGAKACTKVGCGSGAAFDVASIDQTTHDRAATYTLCLDGTCTSTSAVVAAASGVWGPVEGTEVSSGSLAVVDAAGAELARFDLTEPIDADIWYPNGEGCEPTCPRLTLVATDGVLRKAAA